MQLLVFAFLSVFFLAGCGGGEFKVTSLSEKSDTNKTFSCPEMQHIEMDALSQPVCAENIRICSVPNGFGSQVWQGEKFSACVTSSCNMGFHLESDQCLSDSRSCQVSNGQGTQSWNGINYNSCVVSSCNSGYHIENNLCVSNTQLCMAANGSGTLTWAGGSYGSCVVSSCNQNYHLENGQCASNTKSCSISGGSGTQTWNGTAYGTCTPSSCAANFHMENNQCVSNTKSCPIANGSGTQTWNGSSYGDCMVVSCSANYHSENNACLSNTKSCFVENGTGTQSWSGSAYGTCNLVSCNSGSHNEGGGCLSNNKVCTVENGSGFQTWNGTTYGSCQVTSCNPSFHVDNNMCVTDPPTNLKYSNNQNFYTAGLKIVVNRPSSSGGVPTAYTVSPNLPMGLVLDRTSGEISGTPTRNSDQKSYEITASNMSGATKTTISITVGYADQISLGQYHSCAITNGEARCWGYNSHGQIGSQIEDGYGKTTLVPVPITSIPSPVQMISAGGVNTCVIVNGGAKCLGYNIIGQLGSGSSLTSSKFPQEVFGLSSGSGVQAIDVGFGHTCAIVDGGAKCWGVNDRGQLGDDNPTINSSKPVSVQGLASGVTAISAGEEHTCAIVNGGAKCWGNNRSNQTGSADVQNNVPASVNGLSSGVTAISAGYDHTCAIVNGGAQCWGGNHYGQLGNNSTTSSSRPVSVEGLSSGVTAISAGMFYTCAIVNGGAKCWGESKLGKLGDGSTQNSLVPVQVIGLTSGVTAVAAGSYHSCAIVNGRPKCWGYNNYGQLGDGSTETKDQPSEVFVVPSSSCEVTDGQGFLSWNGTDFGTCRVSSCNTGYHIESNQCRRNNRYCSVSNGIGSEIWDGNDYGPCQIDSCDSSFHVENGQCLSDKKVCATSDGKSGTQAWDGSAYGACYASAASANHVIFYSSNTYGANLGGLAGADGICQALATAAGRTETGWKAVLSSSTVNAKDRIQITAPIVDTAGNVLWNNAADFWANVGTKSIQHDENGNLLTSASMVWTGTLSGGSGNTSQTCSNWTSSTSGFATYGFPWVGTRPGFPDRPASHLFNAGTTVCSGTFAKNHLYCISQGSSANESNTFSKAVSTFQSMSPRDQQTVIDMLTEE